MKLIERHDLDNAGEATLALGTFVSKLRFDALPANVVEKAKECVLDGLGCCLFGVTQPWTQMIMDMAREQGGTPQAKVPGTNFRTSVSNAALIASTAGHGFELDDIHVGAHLHPGSLTVPVALAFGESLAGVDGKKFLTAVVAGYEAGLRTGLAATGSHFMRGFHFQGTCGSFAAAATGASMLDLDAEQSRHAIAIAASQASGLMAAQEGAMAKRMHGGRAAQNGVYSALLAARGFTGIPNALEAPYGGFLSSYTDSAQPANLTRGLNTEWRILEMGYKPYASAASTHTALYALQQIMKDNKLKPADIELVHLHCSTMAQRHCAWPYEPQGVTSAQMSLYYTLAVMAHDGEVLTGQFDPARLRDPALLDFIKRIRIEVDPAFDVGGDATRHESRMAVTTRDGRRFERHEQFRKGSPKNPMTREERHTKFRRLAGAVLPPARVEEVIAEIEALEKLPDIKRLAGLVVKA